VNVRVVLRLLPLLVGLAIAYPVGLAIVGLEWGYRFAIASAVLLLLLYGFTWYNFWLMRRDGAGAPVGFLVRDTRVFLGHVLTLSSAAAGGYGFASRSNLLLAAAFGLWWFADDLFTKPRSPFRPESPLDPPHAAPATQASGPLDALLRAAEDGRSADPLIGAKIGGKEVFQRLVHGMRSERGVHIESLLCALGALAGYSCQAGLRAKAVQDGLPETAPLITVKTQAGRQFFFGDPLNHALVESQYSVWSLAAAAAQHNGSAQLPDIKEIFQHVAATVGQDAFGIPRLPADHQASDSPINYLKALWPALLPVVRQFCPQPSEWPILFGIAVQEAIDAGKDVLPPEVALTIVMECAIPMSKVDLEAA
jgi:hypothetical protein